MDLCDLYVVTFKLLDCCCKHGKHGKARILSGLLVLQTKCIFFWTVLSNLAVRTTQIPGDRWKVFLVDDLFTCSTSEKWEKEKRTLVKPLTKTCTPGYNKSLLMYSINKNISK